MTRLDMSVAIRTIPRRQESFTALIDRLQSFGWSNSIFVSADQFITPNENACRALEEASKESNKWILFLEDDAGLPIFFMKNLELWLASNAVDDVHVYPLGCQYAHCWNDRNYEDRSWDYPIDLFYCSVAMVIRREHAASLVEYIRRCEVRQGFDILTGRWHRTVSPSSRLRTPVPSLVEHLGDDSTLAGDRAEKNIVGRFAGFGGWDFQFTEEKNGRKSNA